MRLQLFRSSAVRADGEHLVFNAEDDGVVSGGSRADSVAMGFQLIDDSRNFGQSNVVWPAGDFVDSVLDLFEVRHAIDDLILILPIVSQLKCQNVESGRPGMARPHIDKRAMN
jgi:hypothetical protein